MATIATRLCLVFTLLCPRIGSSIPLITYPFPGGIVSGWSNERGNFAVQDSNIHGFVMGPASYLDSVYSFSAGQVAAVRLEDGIHDIVVAPFAPADVRISATVLEDGTMSGNLLGGTLTIHAGDSGIPSIGADRGKLLLQGNAIEAAATPTNFVTTFLFELVYADPALSFLGDYVTFYDPRHHLVWGSPGFAPKPFKPWGYEWEGAGPFTAYTLYKTSLVPEPTPLALLLTGLGALALARRRKEGT